MEQSKAPNLADEIMDCGIGPGVVYVPNGLAHQVAAELRRLSAIEAERDRYKAHIEAQTQELDELISMAEKLEAEHYALRAEVDKQARLNGMGAERELKLMAERDALRAEVERLRAGPAPLAQGEPVALLWRVRRALALAMRICDRVPNRWHYTHEIGSAEADIGDMVNAHPDGTHGYREIQEAESALVAYLATPEAAPAPVAHYPHPHLWCETCNGVGAIPEAHGAGPLMNCPDCDGKGWIESKCYVLATTAPVALTPGQQHADELMDVLCLAEAGLADIGDADRDPGDDLAWCERRAAEPLQAIRAVLAKIEATGQEGTA